jgi:hypothetical protein
MRPGTAIAAAALACMAAAAATKADAATAEEIRKTLLGSELVGDQPGGSDDPGSSAGAAEVVGVAGEGSQEADGTQPAAAGDGATAGDGGQSLESKATDPTAGLITLTFTEIWIPDYWDADRPGYAFRFRPAMPFRAWGIPNILRVSLTFDHGGLPGYGLEDVQIFDLLVFPMAGGRFALGPLVNLASSGSANPSPFAIGPAIGYVRSTDALNIGLFSQNAFGDGYGVTSLQPVLTWHFAKVLDLSPGDLQYTYDWEADEWVSVPLGAQLGRLARIAKQPLRLFAAYQYNFQDLTGAPKHTVQMGLVLLVP